MVRILAKKKIFIILVLLGLLLFSFGFIITMNNNVFAACQGQFRCLVRTCWYIDPSCNPLFQSCPTQCGAIAVYDKACNGGNYDACIGSNNCDDYTPCQVPGCSVEPQGGCCWNECTDGETRACTVGSYTGTQTCRNNPVCGQWGSCGNLSNGCTLGTRRENICTTGEGVCSTSQACPGYDVCIDPPGDEYDRAWSSDVLPNGCYKYNDSCPCGNNIQNPSTPYYSEACDNGCGARVDYDQDGCSVTCSDTSMPFCRYEISGAFFTVGGEKVARSGVGVNAFQVPPFDPWTFKLDPAPGVHGGALDDPISVVPNSSYGNHTGSGPLIAVENRANQGFCEQESFLVDHFPTVHDVNILNYREIASAINTQAVANGSYEYTDWDSKWSGSYYDSSTYTPPGANDPLPVDSTNIIIPYISNNNTVDSCDNKNPVVFNVVIRDGDDMREVDQINVILADPNQFPFSQAPSSWSGSCGNFETSAARDYFGITLQKQNGGNWTINNLCGISNSTYELVSMDLGAIQSDLLYKSSTPGDNYMNVAFAVRFNDDMGDAFPEGMMKVWVKARSSYEANGQTHYMYSGWDVDPNGGDIYSSDNDWRWGIDFTAPSDANNTYEMATAEVINLNWVIRDPVAGTSGTSSGMRYMDFGCALPSEKNGPAGAIFSSYPFFEPPLPTTWDERLDTYVGRMNDIFENCGINKKWVDGNKSEDEIIPYFTLPVENVNSRVSFDGTNKETSNPIPPGCENTDNNPPCNNIFEANNRQPVPYNFVGTAETRNVPYREFKQMDFLRIYNQAGFTGQTTVNVPRYIAGVEENKSYNLRALVADRACNVRLVEHDISIGGKWMQTVGAEVYTKDGFNTRLKPDTTPYFEQFSSFNSMSTFGVTMGPEQTLNNNTFPGGENQLYAETAHENKNLGRYGLYDDKIAEPERSMITQEVFRDGGLWDRMFEATTINEEESGISRTFIMRQGQLNGQGEPILTPGNCNYRPPSGQQYLCGHNTYEEDLVRFVNDPDFPGGVLKMEVTGSDSIYFEGNMMRNFNKDLILLFYRREGGVIQRLGRVHFWPATYGNAANNPRIVILANADVFSVGSSGHDWEYEVELKTWIESKSQYPEWNQVWRTDDNRRVADNTKVGALNLDKHLYFEPQLPYPAGGASAIEYGSQPGQVIDPGVDMYKMLVLVNGTFESMSEDSVSADPEELGAGSTLTVADVIDRNFERMEIWGGVAAKHLLLDRNLTALDNTYMPAEKFVYDAGLIDAFAKANRQMGIFSQGTSSWQEIGINY